MFGCLGLEPIRRQFSLMLLPTERQVIAAQVEHIKGGDRSRTVLTAAQLRTDRLTNGGRVKVKLGRHHLPVPTRLRRLGFLLSVRQKEGTLR